MLNLKWNNLKRPVELIKNLICTYCYHSKCSMERKNTPFKTRDAILLYIIKKKKLNVILGYFVFVAIFKFEKL